MAVAWDVAGIRQLIHNSLGYKALGQCAGSERQGIHALSRSARVPGGPVPRLVVFGPILLDESVTTLQTFAMVMGTGISRCLTGAARGGQLICEIKGIQRLGLRVGLETRRRNAENGGFWFRANDQHPTV